MNIWLLQIWDLKNSKSINIKTDDFCVPAVLPNGNIIGGCKDKKAKVWDANTGVLIQQIDISEELIFIRAVLPNGYILSQYRNSEMEKEIIVWEMSTKYKIIHRIEEDHEQGHFGLAVLKDGNFIMESGDGLKLFDMSSGKCIHTFEKRFHSHNIEFLKNGNIVVERHSELMVIDINTYTEISTIFTNYGIDQIAVLPNDHVLTYNQNKKIADIWDLSTGSLFQTVDIGLCDVYFSKQILSLPNGEIVCRKKSTDSNDINHGWNYLSIWNK